MGSEDKAPLGLEKKEGQVPGSDHEGRRTQDTNEVPCRVGFDNQRKKGGIGDLT